MTKKDGATKFVAGRGPRFATEAAMLRASPQSRSGALLPLVWLAALCVAFSGSAPAAPQQDLAGRNLFGIVNGKEITIAEYEAFFAGYVRSKMYHGAPGSQYQKLRTEAGEALVRRTLISQEAARRGVVADNDAVDAKMRQYEARYGNSPTWEQMKQRLPSLRAYLVENSRNSILAEQVRKVGDPDEATLRKFYQDNLNLFTEPERARVSAIILAVEPWREKSFWEATRKKGEDLVRQIRKGAHFAELAREHSKHESAKVGGDLGYLHKGALSDNVQKAVDKLSVGEMTGPIRILEGYGVFLLTDRKAARRRAFADVRDRAQALYKRHRAESAWKDFVDGLRSAANIQIDTTVYERGNSEHQTVR